jgi:hypothetical protein
MAIRIRLHPSLLVAVMILALPATSIAQGTGTISGTVTDSTSAVLPGATVIVKNTETLASAPRRAQLGVTFIW